MNNSDTGDEPNTIDDLIPDPIDADWVTVLRCTSCGFEGRMYGNHKPERDEYYWHCQECSPDEYVEHEVVVTTNAGSTPER